MSQLNHYEYYVARAGKSRSLAERASDPAIAAIHTDLAARYDLLATQPETSGEDASVAEPGGQDPQAT